MTTYIIFDTETTGLLLPKCASIEKQPKIIEIGAVKVKGGEVLEELGQLIDPQEALEPKITKITGIEQEDLVGKPKFTEFLPELRKFFSGADVLVAHNMPFDHGVLSGELERHGVEDFPWPAELLCTVAEYTPAWGRRPKMTELYAKILGKDLAQTHRALDDARALHEILMEDGFYKTMDSHYG